MIDLNEGTNWHDFSGSPAILLPKDTKSEWLGFYSLKPKTQRQSPDFSYQDQDYYMIDDFDFDHPKTDYDRISSVPDRVQIIELDAKFKALIFGISHSFGWCKKMSVFVHNMDRILLEDFKSLDWNLEGEVRLCQNMILMNSCNTLIAPFKETEEIQFEPGSYRIWSAEYSDEEQIGQLFKLEKII